MQIIKLRKKDLQKALDLVWVVFQEFVAPDYSKQGIEEFRNFIAYNSIAERFDKGELCFWGCQINGDLTGAIAIINSNHICLLFVRKEYHRQGIAGKLFQTIVDMCKHKDNINNITVNSSPYAKDVYHRLGFVDTDQEQIVHGIRFTPMSSSLG